VELTEEAKQEYKNTFLLLQEENQQLELLQRKLADAHRAQYELARAAISGPRGTLDKPWSRQQVDGAMTHLQQTAALHVQVAESMTRKVARLQHIAILTEMILKEP